MPLKHKDIRAYRVTGVCYDPEFGTYTLKVDNRELDNPDDQCELLLVKTSPGVRLHAFFRDQDWYTKTDAGPFVVLIPASITNQKGGD